MAGAARLVWLTFATLVAALAVAFRANALEVPKLAGRVNDYADLLPPEAEQRIASKLEAHQKKTGQQFAVLTLPSLEGDPLEDFSIRTVEAWKLGDEKRDDGLLLLVVKNDRKARIEVGHGLEGSITDAFSSRIIRGVMAPAFRAGDYPAGIERAVDALIRHETPGASGTLPEPELDPGRTRAPPSLPMILVLLLMVAPFLLPLLLFGRRSGGFGRRGSWGGFYGGYGGFGGGGFGGGGFGGSSGGGFSGGGGSFGGGGASGSW